MSATFHQSGPTWLFHVGARKAGTTWLYGFFQNHPQVLAPRVKEMHYFNVKWLEGHKGFGDRRLEAVEGWYSRLRQNPMLRKAGLAVRRHLSTKPEPPMVPGEAENLVVLRELAKIHTEEGQKGDVAYRRFMLAEHANERVVVDATPDYAVLNAPHFAQMVQEFEGARFLFTMRDPVERDWSHINMHWHRWHNKMRATESIDAFFEQILAGKHKHVRQRSNYPRTIAALKRAVPSHQRMFCFYETMFKPRFIQELCDFIGVDVHPANTRTRVRAGDKRKMELHHHTALRQWLDPVYKKMNAEFGSDLPDTWGQPPKSKTGTTQAPVRTVEKVI